MRYLAIDYGQKRTGLAMCDQHERIASPLTVLTGQAELLEQIAEVVRTEEAQAVLIGLPLNMDGSEGPAAKRVRDFAAELAQKIDIDIYFHDERLSTFQAQGKLAGMDLTRKQKKKHLDAIAAAEILQCFLEKKHNTGL